MDPNAQPDNNYINSVIQAALDRRRQGAAPVPAIQQTMPGAAMSTPAAPSVDPMAVMASRAQAAPTAPSPSQPDSPEETRVTTQLLLKHLQKLLKSNAPSSSSGGQ